MQIIINDTISILNQLSQVLNTCTKEDYNTIPSFCQSSLGGHVRHIIDHYIQFFDQYETGLVNYDKRDRNEDIQTNPQRANQEVLAIIKKLENPLLHQDSDQFLYLVGESGSGESQSMSSVSREVLFLLSHSIHHYAILAMILKDMGKSVQPEFGVAPSTLKYLQSS